MSLRDRIDFSELNKFASSMKLMESDCNDFLEDVLIEFAEKVVDKTKSFTPVDTGALQESWGLATKWMIPYHTRLFSQKKNRMVKKTLFKRGGGIIKKGNGASMSVTISNPQRYAEKVEYDYGYYMLTKSMAIMRSQLPSLYNARFERFKEMRGL